MVQRESLPRVVAQPQIRPGKILLEICIDSVESAANSERGGADRVELCAGLPEGGTTPSAGMIAAVRKKIEIGLHVMIRPRGGDFCYSADEFGIMQRDILIAKQLGANGVVFGILNIDGTVDKDRMRQLIDMARPLKVTCHRAFDMSCDLEQALEDLVEVGADRVLTSGSKQERRGCNAYLEEFGAAGRRPNFRDGLWRTLHSECESSPWIFQCHRSPRRPGYHCDQRHEVSQPED